MSRRNRSGLEMGHDSFLDIVANLVGILIILVVVLGTQSAAMIQEAMNEDSDAGEIETSMSTAMSTAEESLASDAQLQQLAGHSIRVSAARSDSERLEGLVDQYDQELGIREEERMILMMLLEEAKETWQGYQTQIDQDKLHAAKLESEYSSIASKLDKIEAEADGLKGTPEKVVEIEHLPTPMAKTVFGEEIHLRLKNDRVAVVPLEQLIEEVQRDLERSAHGSRQGERQGAVGPVRNFVARFLMEKSSGMVNRGGKMSMATRIHVVRMTLEPLTEPLGQPIEEVIAGNSQVEIELAGRDPGTTTITVWVYPDSYAAFRQLKESLYQRGFATAARPLTADGKIGVSPNGSKSNAQ